jgi:hypothetical protein
MAWAEDGKRDKQDEGCETGRDERSFDDVLAMAAGSKNRCSQIYVTQYRQAYTRASPTPPSRAPQIPGNDESASFFDEASSGKGGRHFIKPSNILGLMRFSKPSGITGDWHEPCSIPCTDNARRTQHD